MAAPEAISERAATITCRLWARVHNEVTRSSGLAECEPHEGADRWANCTGGARLDVINMQILGTIYSQFARNCNDRDLCGLTITMLDIVVVPYRPRLMAFGRRPQLYRPRKTERHGLEVPSGAICRGPGTILGDLELQRPALALRPWAPHEAGLEVGKPARRVTVPKKFTNMRLCL